MVPFKGQLFPPFITSDLSFYISDRELLYFPFPFVKLVFVILEVFTTLTNKFNETNSVRTLNRRNIVILQQEFRLFEIELLLALVIK